MKGNLMPVKVGNQEFLVRKTEDGQRTFVAKKIVLKKGIHYHLIGADYKEKMVRPVISIEGLHAIKDIVGVNATITSDPIEYEYSDPDSVVKFKVIKYTAIAFGLTPQGTVYAAKGFGEVDTKKAILKDIDTYLLKNWSDILVLGWEPPADWSKAIPILTGEMGMKYWVRMDKPHTRIVKKTYGTKTYEKTEIFEHELQSIVQRASTVAIPIAQTRALRSALKNHPAIHFWVTNLLVPPNASSVELEVGGFVMDLNPQIRAKIEQSLLSENNTELEQVAAEVYNAEAKVETVTEDSEPVDEDIIAQEIEAETQIESKSLFGGDSDGKKNKNKQSKKSN